MPFTLAWGLMKKKKRKIIFQFFYAFLGGVGHILALKHILTLVETLKTLCRSIKPVFNWFNWCLTKIKKIKFTQGAKMG